MSDPEPKVEYAAPAPPYLVGSVELSQTQLGGSGGDGPFFYSSIPAPP